MEPLFTFEYELKKEHLRAFCKMYYWHIEAKKWIVLYTLLAILCAAYGIFLWSSSDSKSLSVALFAVSVLSIAYIWSMDWIIYRKTAKENRLLGHISVYTFYEDKFCDQSDVSKQEMDYKIIWNAFRDDQHYFLFTQKSVAHVLPIQCLVGGDPQQFEAFIERKTGSPIKAYVSDAGNLSEEDKH